MTACGLQQNVTESGIEFSRGKKSGEETTSDRVAIDEKEANSLVKMGDATITIHAGLDSKEFGKVLAHEMGHGAYRLNNKAKAFFYPADPNKKGHDKGNPDGEAATNAGLQYNSNYKAAKRSLEEEKKKTKPKQ
ncbi:hypothetical protein D3H65_09130 [Paraflavitalea soli]|uniref:Uncharacterized protein n=1 Tax=Paraflavitalea soli TaxID=2315862 RepID=A0A3B7MR90_9BACT|nr:hypothetical protein [Paraflavitalea soli]AXY74125.1 hypothetical protein D3H65_09130 [Paraflavitalea soli]